jgi:hypothetical protein
MTIILTHRRDAREQLPVHGLRDATNRPPRRIGLQSHDSIDVVDGARHVVRERAGSRKLECVRDRIDERRGGRRSISPKAQARLNHVCNWPDHLARPSGGRSRQRVAQHPRRVRSFGEDRMPDSACAKRVVRVGRLEQRAYTILAWSIGIGADAQHGVSRAIREVVASQVVGRPARAFGSIPQRGVLRSEIPDPDPLNGGRVRGR